MASEIEFQSICNQSIFGEEFQKLAERKRGKITFKKIPNAPGGIAVVYAPNGTGKTSLSKALANQEDTEGLGFTALYNHKTITPQNNVFRVIADQIARNIIPGDTSDYLLGADIKREYQLKDTITKSRLECFQKNFPHWLKENFSVSKQGDKLLSYISKTSTYAENCIKSLANRQKRGSDIDLDEFIEYIENRENRRPVNQTLSSEKMSYIIGDYAGDHVVEQLMCSELETIIPNSNVGEIEQDDDAIGIVKKYCNLNHCVVCDNQKYDAKLLLRRKQDNRNKIYAQLSGQTKDLLDKIANSGTIRDQDPFQIKKRVVDFITTGEQTNIRQLLDELRIYLDNIVAEMINGLIDVFDGTNVVAAYHEYHELQSRIPKIDSDELLFIQQVISSNIEKEITIIRDEENDNNFKLMLDGRPFLEKEREELRLSTGEQNFISLAFEFLLARHSNAEIIVIDDPISSFDSVYKNKIAFCILKFLDNKNQIILTHNTDLIRLLDGQLNNCFNLYMLVNSEGADNGFIPVADKEKRILINLHDLIQLFQNKDDELRKILKNDRQFLMAMIPFMRGYAHIALNGDDIYTRLSELMHGYTTARENVAKIYEDLFGVHFADEIITTQDILDVNCNTIEIIDSEAYPLLAETLRQTLIYYYLRMKVEKRLVDVFEIPIDDSHPMLGQLIRKAFKDNPSATPEEKERNRQYRVFFTSRKTLINEFNHFEGNMNIFQPAIDISSSALRREVDEINGRLGLMVSQYTA